MYGKIDEPVAYADAKIAVLPVPFDGTSTWLKGSARGPAAIMDASQHMELFDIETASEVYHHGITTLEPLLSDDVETMVESTRLRTSKLIDDGKFVVTFGGEHSISIGGIQAFAEHFKKLTVLQFDAHGDSRDSYKGSKFNHACVMARVAEVCPYVQVGIRSMDSTEWDKMNPARTFFAHQILNEDKKSWIARVIDQLNDDVFINIDVDVFDPSIMPSTGTPEPGGLQWYHVMDCIRAVAEKRNIVGMDVVELRPIAGLNGPEFMAAKIVYQTLSYVFNHVAI